LFSFLYDLFKLFKSHCGVWWINPRFPYVIKTDVTGGF
jgi:hypothetical protein